MIKIICVGKVKEKFNQEYIKEYMKRLSKYTKIEIIEVKDYKTDNFEIAIEEESKEIVKYIKPKDYIVSLAIEGKQYSSEEFANKLDNIFINNSDITFIIGGSCGISKSIKEKSNELISFSKMTFPHQLFRILILEQIYRAYKINNNESYHK